MPRRRAARDPPQPRAEGALALDVSREQRLKARPRRLCNSRPTGRDFWAGDAICAAPSPSSTRGPCPAPRARFSIRSWRCGAACASLPGATARVTFWSGVAREPHGSAGGRRQVPGRRLVRADGAIGGRPGASDLGSLGIDGEQARLFQRIAGAMLYSESVDSGSARASRPQSLRPVGALGARNLRRSAHRARRDRRRGTARSRRAIAAGTRLLALEAFVGRSGLRQRGAGRRLGLVAGCSRGGGQGSSFALARGRCEHARPRVRARGHGVGRGGT